MNSYFKIVTVLISILLSNNSICCDKNEQALEKSFRLKNEPLGFEVKLGDLLITLPAGLRLVSFGQDADYNGVTTLNFYPPTPTDEIAGIFIRRSVTMQDWKVPSPTVSVDINDWEMSPNWTLVEAVNLSGTNHSIAILFDPKYQVTVIGRKPSTAIKRMINRSHENIGNNH